MKKKIQKLFRSREDRILAGVCGGLADYFEIDSTLMRVLFVILAFAIGSSFWLYLILIFIMPLESRVKPRIKHKK